MKTADEKARERMLIAAEHYARADKSDPFAYARAVAHIQCGVATSVRATLAAEHKYNSQKVPEPARSAYWDAEPFLDVREHVAYDGSLHRYTVPAYRDLSRP